MTDDTGRARSAAYESFPDLIRRIVREAIVALAAKLDEIHTSLSDVRQRLPRRVAAPGGVNTARRVRHGLVAVLLCAALLLTATPQPAAATPANTCTDPYWTYSLRCQWSPTAVPQANAGTAPTHPSQIKPFTRVFLTDAAVRSFDGTIPVIYVDRARCTQAVCADGATFGEPTDSNRWVFSFTGGGSCSVEESTTPGVYDDPTSCLRKYAQARERDEMTTADEPPMIGLTGINSDNPLANDMFAGFNRVRIEKSSYDRYMGRATFDSGPGTPYAFAERFHGKTLTFNLYQHGYLIVQEAFQALWPGLTYTTWVPAGSTDVRERVETLPPLIEAEQVLFVGHSGGAHGLYHNIDNLAAAPWPNADVRALFDANFVESTENEAFYAHNPPGTPVGGHAYSGDWEGTTLGGGLDPSGNVVNAPFHFDGQDFYSNGIFAEQYDAWDALMDQSCVAAHPPAERWMCNDRFHVLFNHTTTPFLFRQDFSDANQEHTNGHTDHDVIWGDFGNYPWCPSATEPCLPSFSLPQHREHLMEQARRLIVGSGTQSELATGADSSLPGPAPFPTFYAWMPDCSAHDGTYNNAQFFSSAITYGGVTVTLEQWVQDFMLAPRFGAPQWRIDGYTDAAGVTMATAPCP